MTLGNLKIFKEFKIHHCSQHWLDLKKVVAPLEKENKNPLLPMTFAQFAQKIIINKQIND